MDTMQFVPSLERLVDVAETHGSQCVWLNREKTQRCRNKVAKPDVDERGAMILRLRVLLSSDEGGTIAEPRRASETCALLKDISGLLLCKASHRVFSTKIHEKWVDERAQLMSPTSRPATSNTQEGRLPNEQIRHSSHGSRSISENLLMANQIRQKLAIEDCERPQCVGKTKKSTRCANLTSSKNYTRINAIIGEIAEAISITQDIRDLLHELAQLFLCRVKHQDQADSKSTEWLKQMEVLFRFRHPDTEVELSPSTPRNTRLGSETPESVLSDIWSRASSSEVNTPATSPTGSRSSRSDTRSESSPSSRRSTAVIAEGLSQRILYIDDDAIAHESLELPQVSHSRNTRRTTAERARGCLPARSVVSTFLPPKRISQEQAMNKLIMKIEACLLTTEEEVGYIYGYRRDANGFIKIGYSKYPAGRMNQWASKCNYTPEVLFSIEMPHAGKVERLIHISLHKERFHEKAGTCNSGKGCDIKHIEWFKIEVDRAKDEVNKWKRWIESRPYDKDGYLTQKWKNVFKTIRSDCLLESWQDRIDDWLMETIATGEFKTELEGDGTSVSTPGVKTQVEITETRVKNENEDWDFSLRSRQYRMGPGDVIKDEFDLHSRVPVAAAA